MEAAQFSFCLGKQTENIICFFVAFLSGTMSYYIYIYIYVFSSTLDKSVILTSL